MYLQFFCVSIFHFGPTKGGGIKGQLLHERKITFNGNPAYEMSFIHKGEKQEYQSRCILLKIDTTYYEVSYFIAHDVNYMKNLDLIEQSLKTLQL